MHSKLIITIFIGLSCYSIILLPQPLYSTSLVTKSSPKQVEITIHSTSTRLKIPKINVDAAVESVGLTPSGAMDVPKVPADTAWLDIGPRPGNTGSAVIAGHYGPWKNGEVSVFDDLNKLSKGDSLYIEDEKGKTTAFVVRESKRYNPNEEVSEVFNSNDGKSHLNLITCDGVWNEASKSYSKRLVVFTDKK